MEIVPFVQPNPIIKPWGYNAFKYVNQSSRHTHTEVKLHYIIKTIHVIYTKSYYLMLPFGCPKPPN